MKKLFAIFFIQIIFSTLCSAQNPKLDSLYNKLQTAKEDTNKVKLLYSIRDWQFYTNLSQSYVYDDKALALSEKLNFNDGIVNGYVFKSATDESKEDFKGAWHYLSKIIPFIKQANNQKKYASFYNNLSGYYDAIDYCSDAMDYSNRALRIADELNDTSLLAETLDMRSQIYSHISDYETANNYLFEVIKIYQKRNNKLKLMPAYDELGLNYIYEHKYDKALDCFYNIYKIAKENNTTIGIAAAQQEIGNIYLKEKQWNKALDFLQQAIATDEIFNDSLSATFNKVNVARIYVELGYFDKAVQMATSSLQIAQSTDYKLGAGRAYLCLGEVYMKQKRYAKAVYYLNEALGIFKDIDDETNLSSAYQDLSYSYRALNNYNSAYNYSDLNNALKDSILNEESVKKTVEMGAVFNSDTKDKEIALLSKDKKISELEIKKQTLLVYSFMVGFAFMCILFFFIYRNYHIRQLLKLQKLRNKIASDLHDDIGSTLSSISIFTLVAREGSKEVIPMLDKIGEYSRSMLESMSDIVWSINPDNDNFEKIILRMRSFAFELLRTKNIDFEFDADESLDSLKVSMELRKNLYLIFKEATNNMAKYSEASSALFSITSSKNVLTMIIRDNGKGFDPNKENQGNGLKNMKKRAGEIGAQFLIESEPGSGTTIQLLIKAA